MSMTISDEKIIKEKAYTLLVSAGVRSFPLRMKPVIDFLQAGNNISFIKYSTLARLMGAPVETVGFKVGSNEAALVYCGPDKPASICYRDVNIPKARIRWNLGHEVAHFVCGHHLIRYRAKCAGLKISEYTAAKIETEANVFSREMHAPLELVLLFMGNYKVFDRPGAFAILRGIFQMSVPASYYYAKRIFSKPIRELARTENAMPFTAFYHEFTSTFNRSAFEAVLRRYEPEYDMFETHLRRSALPDYRLPYQESISAIVSRVLPRNAEEVGPA